MRARRQAEELFEDIPNNQSDYSLTIYIYVYVRDKGFVRDIASILAGRQQSVLIAIASFPRNHGANTAQSFL